MAKQSLIKSIRLDEQHGFSLFESLITVLLITVVTATAVLNFPEISRSFNHQNTRELFRADLRRVKDEAAKAGARGIITVATDKKSYSYGLDYSPYSAAVPPAMDQTIGRRNLASGFTITSPASIYFNSRGILVNSSGSVSTVAISMSDSEGTYFAGTIYSTGALY